MEPDLLGSSEARRSGSTLFKKNGENFEKVKGTLCLLRQILNRQCLYHSHKTSVHVAVNGYVCSTQLN